MRDRPCSLSWAPGAPVFRWSFLLSRTGQDSNLARRAIKGARNAGCWPHPRPRVTDEFGHTSVVTARSRTPGVPRAMWRGLVRVSPVDSPPPLGRQPRRRAATLTPSGAALYVLGKINTSADTATVAPAIQKPNPARPNSKPLAKLARAKLKPRPRPGVFQNWIPAFAGMTGETIPGLRCTTSCCTAPGMTQKRQLSRNDRSFRAATDASASAAPWPRSGGCARASPRTAGRPLPACGRCSCRCRSACAARAPRAA